MRPDGATGEAQAVPRVETRRSRKDWVRSPVPRASLPLPATSCPFPAERWAELGSGLPEGTDTLESGQNGLSSKLASSQRWAPPGWCGGQPTRSLLPHKPRPESGAPALSGARAVGERKGRLSPAGCGQGGLPKQAPSGSSWGGAFRAVCNFKARCPLPWSGGVRMPDPAGH